jgi:YD repeat-containing protein
MEKQSKTESNNTKWKIQIDGDKEYIEGLIEGFKTLKREDIIFKENENFFFNANLFQESASVNEIIEKTNTFLTIIKSVPPLKPRKDYRVIKIVNVEERSDDASTVKTYDGEGNLREITHANGKRESCLKIDDIIQPQRIDSVNLNGEICLCNYDLETIRKQKLNESEINYLKKQIEEFIKLPKTYFGDKEIKEIVNIESKFGTDLELSKWAALRKIYEAIRVAVDELEKLKAKKWVTSSDQLLDDFYDNACYYHLHPEIKDPKKFYKKPSRKIDLSEAEEIISTWLLEYIKEKVQNQGDEQ